MTTKIRFRKKVLALTALAACSLFFAASCQKQPLKPEDLTQAELESINQHVIDYALQVIPDIHEVMPLDLIKAMDSIPTGNTLPNGQPEIISALHFGDNPPNLYKMINDTILGFITDPFLEGYNPMPPYNPVYSFLQVKKYIPCGIPISTLEEGAPDKRCYNFLFHDQHRGIAQTDYKCIYIDEGPDLYLYETAHKTDSVFIMGEGDLFTAYYFIHTEKKHCTTFNPIDNGPHLAVILSGKVTENGRGIEDLYYGYKVLNYDVMPLPPAPGMSPTNPNVNDIVILSPLVNPVPFRYWDPNHSYDN